MTITIQIGNRAASKQHASKWSALCRAVVNATSHIKGAGKSVAMFAATFETSNGSKTGALILYGLKKHESGKLMVNLSSVAKKFPKSDILITMGETMVIN